jgi:hypothetical protein
MNAQRIPSIELSAADETTKRLEKGDEFQSTVVKAVLGFP